MLPRVALIAGCAGPGLCLLWLPKERLQNAQNAQKGVRFYALGLLATRYSPFATSGSIRSPRISGDEADVGLHLGE